MSRVARQHGVACIAHEKCGAARSSPAPCRKPRIQLALAVLLLTAAAAPHAAFASRGMDPEEAVRQADNWSQVEAMLTAELQGVVDRQRRIDGQERLVTIRARVDPVRQKLTLLLSRGYVPRINGGEFEDLQHQLTVTGIETLRPAIDIVEVELLFDGRTLFDYFPEDAPPPRRVPKPAK